MTNPTRDPRRVWLLLAGLLIGVVLTLWISGQVDEGGRPGPSAQLPAGQQHSADDEEEDEGDETHARVRQMGDEVLIVLRPEEVTLAGIVTEAPREVSFSPAEKSFGRVVDPAPLLEAVRAFVTAQKAAQTGRAVLAALEQRLTRLRKFAYDGEITVARELAELEVQVRREMDTAATREAARAAAEEALAARWGTALAAGAKSNTSWFRTLAQGGAQLIEFGAKESPPPTVLASPLTHGEDSLPVDVVGAAPGVLGTTQWATYYGIARDARLRAGMHLTCEIPGQGDAVTGWLIPQAALLWHEGTQWFYVEQAPGTFRRHSARESLVHPEGRALAVGLDAESPLVVQGAQALLAEEFRARIPEEDDD